MKSFTQYIEDASLFLIRMSPNPNRPFALLAKDVLLSVLVGLRSRRFSPAVLPGFLFHLGSLHCKAKASNGCVKNNNWMKLTK